MSKYYTPERSEFTINFGYEINIGGKWEQRNYRGEDMNCLLPILNMKRIRVKCLDGGDIKSLEWSPSHEKDIYIKNKYFLHVGDKVTIYYKIDNLYNRTLFEGEMRNISELKSISKMLGV